MTIAIIIVLVFIIAVLTLYNMSIHRKIQDFQNILNKLSNIVFPLLPAKKSKEKVSSGYQYNNGYSSGFSNNVNNTLNNMRKKY